MQIAGYLVLPFIARLGMVAQIRDALSYGAILKIKKERKEEYDWDKINLAEEFRENGEFVLGNLMSRISLLIAEITSSFGQR